MVAIRQPIGCLTHWPLEDLSEIFKWIIFKLISATDGRGIYCENTLKWWSASHYLSQYWLIFLSPYGVTRPHWVNLLLPSDAKQHHRLWTQLTHWGRTTHICVGKLTTIGSDNGLSPGRRQAIIWTNAGILLIGPLGTNFSEILIGIQTFLFKKMHLKMSSAKWRLFCLGLNVLMITLTYCQLDPKTELQWNLN